MKPSIPKGTRDFGPTEMARRNYIFNTIRTVFELYGFQQIETPAMENITTLTGKYGEEGDQLIFKILNSRIYDSKDKGALQKEFELSLDGPRNSEILTEKALRYDLTVPFARYVVQHQNEITFPFKRYQIQPVWRADRPQKGRYREFFQCDADIIGSLSILNELELVQIIISVFKKLDVPVKIKFNNRKILSGIAEYIGYPERITDITIALDKFEKVGLENVLEELTIKGIEKKALKELESILFIQQENIVNKIKFLDSILLDSKIGKTGLEEMQILMNYIAQLDINSEIEFDLALARGLNYYTGTIIEVKAKDIEIGSIAGGGRYDNLTGVFGLNDISGVGISFGADRIYDVLNQLNKFPANSSSSVKVLFTNFGEKEENFCLILLKKLRDSGINAEIYPERAKTMNHQGKQMSYADKKKIPFVAIVGENEILENKVSVKNMQTGEQIKIEINKVVDYFRNS
jgi:histidyl-tRNA synthetase